MSILHAYIKSGSLSILAKIFNIVSVFGTLYLLNKVLEKTQFGEFFIVFSLITVISLVMGSGAQALTMYHVSRRQEEADAIAGQAFWIFTLISVVVAALLSLFSSLIAELMGNANLQNWLSIMAWFIPPYIATLILPAYWRARQNIAAYLGFNEVLPNVLRLAGLGLIYVQSLPPSYVAIFYVLSVLIPAVIVYGMKPFAPYCKVWYLSKWDWDYMGKITLTQLLNQPFRGIDVVLVGTLTSATIAADYALSAKLVALLLIPKQILGSLQVPRMGALLEKNDRITLLKEFKVMQMLSGAALIIGCFILILFGPFLLSLFGAYQSAYPILLILAAGALVRTAGGASGDLMTMLGHAGWNLICGLISAITIVGLIVIFAPLMGGEGAALAVLIGTAILFALYWSILKFEDNLPTIALPVFVSALAMIAALLYFSLQ